MSNNFPGNPYAGREPHTAADGIMSALDTLSFEQRTANLIAYLDVLVKVGDTSPGFTTVVADVHQRLGFREDTP